jgi:hypothetical protein
MTHQQLREVLERLGPLAKGSLAKVAKPCVRPNCPACRAGRKHPMWIFSFQAGGKRQCRYVPVELVPRLKQALANGRAVEAYLHAAGPALIRAYRDARDRQA